MQRNVHPDNLRIMRAGAARYARAERSDPFAYARALTHTHNGVAAMYNANGEQAYYNAEEHSETRTLSDGREYTVPAYKNIVRP